MTNTVPAYVVEESSQKTGIIVNGGTNWDLSRSAAETPISKYVARPAVKPCYCEPTDASYEGGAYRVKDMLPARDADLSLNYTKGSFVLTADQKKLLSELPSSKGVIIAGNSGVAEASPTELASKRVSEVVKYLKAKGIKVYFTDSFGASRPVTSESALDFKNARVDIWVQVKGTAESN